MASIGGALPKFEELKNMKSKDIKYISEPSIGNYYAQNNGVIFNSFKYLGVNVYPDELLGVVNKDIINGHKYYEFKPSYNSETVKVTKKSAKIIEVQPPQKGGNPRKSIRRKSKKRKMRKTRRKSLSKN